MHEKVITNLYKELHLAKTLVFDKCGLDFNGLIIGNESQEYGACSFKLNNTCKLNSGFPK